MTRGTPILGNPRSCYVQTVEETNGHVSFGQGWRAEVGTNPYVPCLPSFSQRRHQCFTNVDGTLKTAVYTQIF